MSNEITAYFKGRTGVAESVYQNDYGIVMVLDDIDLPAHFDCYFSILNQDEAVPGVGADNRVAIPNTVLANPGNVTIHIPLHTGENDSEVEYVVYFKVIGRARPIDDGTPTQMTAIEQALALLQNPITNIEQIVNEALAFTGKTFDEIKFDFDNLDDQFQTAVSALTVDSEVQNIRVGDDNVTYTSAGDAVRTQFSNVKNALSVGTKNLFDSYGDINRKRNGASETYTDIKNTVNSDGSIVVNASAARSYGIGQRITLPVGKVAISAHIDSVGNGNWVTTRLYKVSETPTLIGETTSRGGDIVIKANIEEAGVYLVGWFVNGGTPPCGAKVSNIQVEINDYVTSYIPNRITTPYYTNIKYPKLNVAQKEAIVSLCSDYYLHRDVFTYDYGIFRNAYVDKTECFDNNLNKYKLNCSAFVQFILMGRKASDFYETVNDETIPKRSYLPTISNADGYADIGYYFNFKYRPVGFFDQSYYEYYDSNQNLIFGDISLNYHTLHPDRPIYKVTSKYFYVYDEYGDRVVLNPSDITPRLDDNGNQYRRYRGYENLDQRTDDVGVFTWYSYFSATRPAYTHHQQINNFMNAHDMALELYEMGCEIPYSELDVGDIVFFKAHNRSSERSDFATWAYRNITHVAIVIGFQNMTLNDGTEQKQPIFMECTGTMQQVIIETSNAFSGEVDRMRSESLHHNIVMCARHPIAFGYKPNVPSEITAIPS